MRRTDQIKAADDAPVHECVRLTTNREKWRGVVRHLLAGCIARSIFVTAASSTNTAKAKLEERFGFGDRLKLFMATHWRGVVSLVIPIALIFMVVDGGPHLWVAYTILVMGLYWVTECIPIAVTGFIPLITFPFSGVMDSRSVSKVYVNDTVMLFLGSLYLASSVEQSGYHKRLAYSAVQVIGYSHMKLLLAMCSITTFVSMWITNTAATTMMVPINFAILKVFEDQKIINIYDRNPDGSLEASDITSCYFCAATFSATIGGIGTLIGTGTNLVFKGLFHEEHRHAPDHLNFPAFSAFTIPYMICLEAACYMYFIIVYLGVGRPNSPSARLSHIPPAAKKAAKETIERDSAALGPMRYHEYMVVILFSFAMLLFFSRSPKLFEGWADTINVVFKKTDDKFIQDSVVSSFVSVIMLALPCKLTFFEHFKVKYIEDLPKKRVRSVLDWYDLNRVMPYSFTFLLGGGFALSNAAKSSTLNDRIGHAMAGLNVLPNYVVMLLVIIVVVFITNFASNIAVANVFVPISMKLATKLNVNPLWYCLVSGISASFCFMIPVGTPGNLIVQSAAKISVTKMMKAGFGPTISTILLSWFFFYFYCPVIFPVHEIPEFTPPTTAAPS